MGMILKWDQRGWNPEINLGAIDAENPPNYSGNEIQIMFEF